MSNDLQLTYPGNSGFHFALETVTNFTVCCGLKVSNADGKKLEGKKNRGEKLLFLGETVCLFGSYLKCE